MVSREARALSPLLVRERLAEHLRGAREEAGLSQAVAAAQLEWSPSKLQRVETAIVSVSVTDTKALLDLYGIVDPVLVRRLRGMASAARRRDRYSSYKKYLTAEYQTLLSYELSASAVRSLNAFALPGLLQTPGYARAMLALRHQGEKLEKLVEARVLRQEILDGAGSPHFTFLVDEGLLRRQVGGSEVMADQLAHLQRLSERTNVELRVIPFTAHAHLGLWGPFMIMTVPPSELTGDVGETIVYRETGDAEYLIRGDQSRIVPYEEGFADVERQTLSRSDTRHLISSLSRQLDTAGSTSAS